MPVVSPYIPEKITVHLGSPSSWAANVTVPFADYVKNVLSSEIYPTWEPAALEANALAVISFALNRVYTEYYRSRGYDFQITSSTAIDQKYIQGRNIFENLSVLVDRIFSNYLRRAGFVEPLAAKFCNGRSVTCEGLSQWGSQELAQAGYGMFPILQSYYGYDLELVTNAPVAPVRESYPGAPVRRGDTGENVAFIQTALNRVSQDYPAIPKVTADGVFGELTEAAVRDFQKIFSLTADGIVGRATWYQLVRLYVGILRLSELQSRGQTFTRNSWAYPDAVKEGDTGEKVTQLQYMLAVLAEFLPELPSPAFTGSFGAETKAAVTAWQHLAGLPVTGEADGATWDAIYAQFEGIEQTVFREGDLFPADPEKASRLTQLPSSALVPGMQDKEATA